MADATGKGRGVALRPYASGDLDELVALWNRCLVADPTNPRWFARSVLTDRHFALDGLIVATVDDALVGAIYAAHTLPEEEIDRPRVGYVPFFFVDPDRRQRGIGHQLMAHALTYLHERGCSAVEFAMLVPHYVAPGLDEDAYPAARGLLLSAGFTEHGRAVSMGRSLLGFAVPDEVRQLRAQREREGYAIVTPSDGELAAVIAFAEQEFGLDWGTAVRDSAWRDHEVRPVTVVRSGERILGFATHSANRPVAERFGPIGVSGEARGLGLGRLLLYETLVKMRSVGLQNAWFLTAEEDAPAGALYVSAGFGVLRRWSLWSHGLAARPATPRTPGARGAASGGSRGEA